MDFSQPALDRIHSCLNKLGLPLDSYRITAIPGDLSPRRYFRLDSLLPSFENHFKNCSVMAMVFDSVKPPEAEAKTVKTSDESYIEITDFFVGHKIPMPTIYNFIKDLGIILIEDLGSTPLIDLAKKQDPRLQDYYKKAINLILKIQQIKIDKSFFIYNRGFDANVYLREVSQFLEFVVPKGISSSSKELVQQTFKLIAEEVSNFNRVLVHRDFHSWNLMVDKFGDLRLIDFQDALMGVRCYDLVALLHERDIDLILSSELIKSVEDEFFSSFKDNFLREVEYPLTQLQRDLKVSGLFVKVKELRGLDSYLKWVPGTLHRIELTLELLKDRNVMFKNFTEMLKDCGVFK